MSLRSHRSRITALILVLSAAGLASAQCSGGGRGQSGSTGLASNYSLNSLASPYTQSTLPNGYSLSTMGSSPYQLNTMAAQQAQMIAAYERAARLQVQAQSEQLRNQVQMAQNYQKQLARSSAEKRKQSEQDAEEARSLKEERIAARKAKRSGESAPASSSSRLVSKT